MTSNERIDGKVYHYRSMVYMQYKPFKIFLRGFNEDGEVSNEILYKAGENGNNALISPNGFPYFNLNLNPMGSAMRNNRHLTLFEAGSSYLVGTLKKRLDLYLESGDSTKRFFLEREGIGLLKLTISNPDYDFVPYTVLPNEQFRDMCNKLGVPEYKVIEINDNVDDFEDLSKGKQILVPNFFAKKFELIIRESDFVPLHAMIYDDLGLYSEYKYIYFDCHPYIDSQTFSDENPTYTL